MEAEQASRFRDTKHFELSVSLLRWSDAAERAGAGTVGDEGMRLESYRTMLEEHFLDSHNNAGLASPFEKTEVLRPDPWQ
jgi:hypothetical protein